MTNPRDLERGDEAAGGPPTRRRRQGPPAALREDAVAVVIGINTYQDPKIPDLRCARADAQAIYDVLTDPEVGRFKPQNVMLLLDADATERRIRSALGTQLPRRAPKDGTVVIYYAGHGAPVVSPGASGDGIAKYLVPHDALADDLEASAIPMTKIQEYFQRLNTSQVICFLDSCYSGSAGGRSFEYGDVQIRAVLTDEFLDSLANEGRFVVTSCATNEVSLESNALGHGVFTYYLVKGLQGAADTDEDGKVTIDELYTYVYNNVEKEARALGGSMNPLRKGAVRGTVYLTEFESASQRAARIANEAGESAWDRGDLAAAGASWTEALRLEPGHERATFGLAAIAERRAKEDADRREQERKREEELTGQRRKLLDLANAHELSMREFNEAMSLLEQDAATMAPRERTLRRYLDSLLQGELSVRAYRQSSALLVADGSTGMSPGPRVPDETITAPAPASAAAPLALAYMPAAPKAPTQPHTEQPTERGKPVVEAHAPSTQSLVRLWGMRAGAAAIAVVAWLALRPGPKPPPVDPDVRPTPVTAPIASAWASLGTTPSCDETESHSYMPDGVRDYSCRFLKTLGMAAIERLAGMPVFASGPHDSTGLNLESYRFGHYNPKFVEWATEHLIPSASMLPQSVRERIQHGALIYYRVNAWLTQHPEAMQEIRADYEAAVATAPPDPAPGEDGPRGYNGPAYGVVYRNSHFRGSELESWDATLAAGFWIRREIDGTRTLFAAAVVKLLTAIDETFTPPVGVTPTDVSRPTLKYSLASGRGSGGYAIAMSPDGKQVALASIGTLLRAWNVASGTQQFSVRSNDGGGAGDIAFSRDGRLIAVANFDNTVRVFDASSGATRFSASAEGSGNVLSAVFMADGKTLVTGGTNPAMHVWDVASGQLVRQISGHKSNVLSLALSPDGRLLASSSADGTLKLWNTADFSPVASLNAGRGMCIAFHPSGSPIAVGMYEGRVQLVDVASRSTASTITVGAPVLDLAWNPAGSQIATAAGDSVSVYDAPSGQHRYAIAARQAGGVAWSSDGSRMAISQTNQGTRLWAVPR